MYYKYCLLGFCGVAHYDALYEDSDEGELWSENVRRAARRWDKGLREEQARVD